MLSRCFPEDEDSAVSAASMILGSLALHPFRTAAAIAPPTADAALEPRPPETGRCRSMLSLIPVDEPIASRKALAAMVAVFFSGSVGIRSALRPSIRPMERVSAGSAEMISPRPSRQRPRQSNPGPTLPIVAGAKTRIVILFSPLCGCDGHNIVENPGSGYIGPCSRPCDD